MAMIYSENKLKKMLLDDGGCPECFGTNKIFGRFKKDECLYCRGSGNSSEKDIWLFLVAENHPEVIGKDFKSFREAIHGND